MKDETLIIFIVAGFALLFWAVSTGLIKTTGGGVNVGGGIVAPQPATNYSGYLAASTAPGVSSALNSILGGVGTSVAAWLSPEPSTATNTPFVNQGPMQPAVSAPSAAAQPQGPSSSGLVAAQTVQNTSVPVGPVIDPSISYLSTNQDAFNYLGLSSANAVDPGYSLETYAPVSS
jgi:hypothetical protein